MNNYTKKWARQFLFREKRILFDAFECARQILFHKEAKTQSKKPAKLKNKNHASKYYE